MRLLLTLALSTAALAQEAEALLSTMKDLSAAVSDLDHAIAGADRTALTAPLRSIERALPALRAATLPNATAASEAILAIEAAIADLRAPVDDGTASDAFDLQRLRRACTECHLQNRGDYPERGWFPNRGGLLTGVLDLRDQGGAALADRSGAVVFLEATGLAPPPLPRKPQISQRGRRFAPAVLTVTPGTTVRFPNDDVVFHNVFSLSRGNAFDLGIYGKGIEHERVLAQPGLVKVHCNIHPDMAADVLVLPTPHTAVTNGSGFWAIPDVPPGDYTLRVWQALADEARQPVHVDADAALNVPLALRETKPRVQHLDKHGRRYDARY